MMKLIAILVLLSPLLCAATALSATKTFSEYCESSTDPAIRQTVAALLAMVNTKDCAEGERQLLTKSDYTFKDSPLSDFVPLAAIAKEHHEQGKEALTITIAASSAVHIQNIPLYTELTLERNPNLEKLTFVDVGHPEQEYLDLKIHDNPRFAGIQELIAHYGSYLRDFSFKGNDAIQSLKFPAHLENLYRVSITDAKKLSHIVLPESSPLAALVIARTDLTRLDNLAKNTTIGAMLIADCHLNDMTALAHLTGIGYLQLLNCEFADLTVLEPLKKLKYLNIRGNRLKVLPRLKNHKLLKTLMVLEPELEDASALTELPWLSSIELDLGSLQVPLPELTFNNLRGLTLRHAAKMPLLKGDTRGYSLQLDNCTIDDYTPLIVSEVKAYGLTIKGPTTRALPEDFTRFEGLTGIILENVPPSLVKNHSLRFPRALYNLEIINSGLDRLPPDLKNYRSLMGLRLSHGRLHGHFDGSSFINSELSYLDLSHNNISSFDLSTATRRLAWINLSANDITDLYLSKLPPPVWARHPRQKFNINLSYNPIYDLRPIETLLELTDRKYVFANIAVGGVEPVSAANCPVNSQKPWLPKLCRELATGQKPSFDLICRWARWSEDRYTLNVIKDVLGIENCAEGHKKAALVESLDLSGRGIESFWPINALFNLKSLNVSNNKVAALTEIHRLSKLTELNFSHNRVDDVSPLAQLSELKVLKASDNEIASVAPLVDLTKLEPSQLELGSNPLGQSVPKTDANCPTEGPSKAITLWCKKRY